MRIRNFLPKLCSIYLIPNPRLRKREAGGVEEHAGACTHSFQGRIVLDPWNGD